MDMDYDPERSATESHRTPSTGRSRRTLRYTEASPLRKTGNRLMTLSRNIRRVSLRVVNMTGMGIDEHVRLADASDEKRRGRAPWPTRAQESVGAGDEGVRLGLSVRGGEGARGELARRPWRCTVC